MHRTRGSDRCPNPCRHSPVPDGSPLRSGNPSRRVGCCQIRRSSSCRSASTLRQEPDESSIHLRYSDLGTPRGWHLTICYPGSSRYTDRCPHANRPGPHTLPTRLPTVGSTSAGRGSRGSYPASDCRTNRGCSTTCRISMR